MINWLAFSFLFVYIFPTAGIVEFSPLKDIQYLLPEKAKPLRYNITLEPDFKKSLFYAYVEITVKVESETDTITLHSQNLTIHNITVFDTLGYKRSVVSHQFSTIEQFLSIKFTFSLLQSSSYILKIHYTGNLTETPVGFYKQRYIAKNGKIRWLAASNFKPIHARKAFPCYDEPEFKAIFEVQIVRDSIYRSLSNGPFLYTLRKGEKFVDFFEETGPISTYMVAFVVTDFTSITRQSRIWVYGRSEAINNREGDFALDASYEALNELEHFTNLHTGPTPFQLDKLDLIATPHYPLYGCDNWGLLIFDENALLFNVSTSLSKAKETILLQISHEIAHQWFGGVVTMKWWTWLWLNEGIATYLSHRIAHKIKPHWRLRELFLEKIQKSLYEDSARPKVLSKHIDTPKDIQARYDDISYTKAGAIMRMLKHVLTISFFRLSLTRHLNNLKFGVAESSNLFTVVQGVVKENPLHFKYGDLDILKMMWLWETLAGYPVVRVIRVYPYGPTTFKQNAFYFDGIHKSEEVLKKWFIPITWTASHNLNFLNTKPTLWLKDVDDLVVDLELPELSWIIVNIQVTGYYRVLYDDKNWLLLADYLKKPHFEKIHPLNRAQLIDDAFSFAKCGLLNYTIAFTLADYLHKETDYIVHSAFLRNFTFLNAVVSGSPYYSDFKRRMAALFDKALRELSYQELNFEDGQHINNVHRRLVIDFTCEMNHALCRRATTYDLNRIRSISFDLQFPIICGGLRDAKRSVWDMVDEYSNTVTGKVQENVIRALGCTEDKEILLSYLQREINKNSINVFANIYNSGTVGRIFVWNYIVDHFDDLNQRFGKSFGEMAEGISVLLTTEQQLEKFKRLHFIATGPIFPHFNIALKNVEANVNWAKKYLPDIERWLKIDMK